MAEISSDVLSGLGLTSYGAQTAKESSGTLGQSDFLKLMTTQLATQDPMKPMENGDFLSQMAQFSTVTGIEALTEKFGALSLSLNQGQALQAAALVGKEVLSPATKSQLDAGQGMRGSVGLSASVNQLTVGVYDSTGQLMQTLDLGAQASGMADFTWDGLTSDGQPAPEGIYEFRATASSGDASAAVETFLGGQVQSVTADYASGGLILNVQGLGGVAFGDVARIG
ncbi:flagellar hook assembly protein FlgD [Thiocystis violascens]|uniref:Basal-body rod modification protein FlgD n=1 Tax=Thiocystis violascens (strain ATCC 17096 / DSM 198 / 6111) TaxID=765911 RepID=I3Y648_THIV6|nr:flagellar hook assembly protein FlgD [Thiocystis violascens]AFL72466.1 flagellar hook capping protein [Thiocystis violascens DSM 198]